MCVFVSFAFRWQGDSNIAGVLGLPNEQLQGLGNGSVRAGTSRSEEEEQEANERQSDNIPKKHAPLFVFF